MDILRLIQDRQSSRMPFDSDRQIPEEHLRQILEAARWAPTAHNMQNFEIVVVDDSGLLDEVSAVRSETSLAFVEENYEQLCFSEDELRLKKRGMLGMMFPPEWRTPGLKPRVDPEHPHSVLGERVRRCAALVLVTYDPRQRAPASEGDALGMISLGCVLENMWLVAHSLEIGFHAQCVLRHREVEAQLRTLLAIPEPLKIGFAVRLGYPAEAVHYLRVRREVTEFAYRNRYGRAL
jgi:nitroreductase